jgi:prolyl-tRNA editing enzyme YbaK/EbsC (Cys-tRNA(Pro) deacylase)
MVLPQNINENLSKSAQDFQLLLQRMGYKNRVVEFSQSTRTAQQAADAIGVDISQIVKSLLFKTEIGNDAVMVLVSGRNRVDEGKLSLLLGERVIKANPEFVREKTGFSIGGVPPIGHLFPIQIFIDQDLENQDEIWAAAGSPFAVFQLTSGELQNLSNGKWVSIKTE